MAAVAFDLGHIATDRVLAVIAAIVRIRLCSTNAHIVLTFLACHCYLHLPLSSRGFDLDIDVLLLRTAHKTAAVEEYARDDRHDDDQRQRPYDAAACSFTFCHFLFLPCSELVRLKSRQSKNRKRCAAGEIGRE